MIVRTISMESLEYFRVIEQYGKFHIERQYQVKKEYCKWLFWPPKTTIGLEWLPVDKRGKSSYNEGYYNLIEQYITKDEACAAIELFKPIYHSCGCTTKQTIQTTKPETLPSRR